MSEIKNLKSYRDGRYGFAHLAVLLLVLSGAPMGEAEEKNDTDDAPEEIIITATRVERPQAEVNRSLAVVNRETIESIQPLSIPQVLSYQPNVAVVGGPRAASQSINIRGLGGNKVLQTVDGARQSFDSGHRPAYFLDPELLQSVEAVRGPASSLWGSSALGGVVAQQTLLVRQWLGEDRALGGFVKTGYNDNSGLSPGTTAAVMGAADRFDWLVSSYYRDSNDTRLGNDQTLQGSAQNSSGVLGKFTWTPTDSQTLAFNYRQADQDGTVPGNGTEPIDLRSNFLIQRNQAVENVHVGWEFKPQSGRSHIRLLAYTNQVAMEEIRVSDSRRDNTQLDVQGLNLWNLSQLGEVDLQYGLDVHIENFSADRGGSNRPLIPAARTDVYSVWSQALVPLASKWQLELSLRYDSFGTEANNQAHSDSEFSPSAALLWQAAPWARLGLRHDRAFRAPNSEELYTAGTHFCAPKLDSITRRPTIDPITRRPAFVCNTFVPNAALQSERAANTEWLASFDFAGALGADQLQLDVSFFRNRLDHFVEQVVTDSNSQAVALNPDTTTWINLDEATIRGFEMEVSGNWGNLSARLAYGQTRGSDGRGYDLWNIPADTWTGDVAYDFSVLNLLAGVRLTHAADQLRTACDPDPIINPDFCTSAYSYTGYSLADLYLSWQPAGPAALKFDFSIRNLQDRYYSRAWDQLPQAGREVILAARYSF